MNHSQNPHERHKTGGKKKGNETRELKEIKKKKSNLLQNDTCAQTQQNSWYESPQQDRIEELCVMNMCPPMSVVQRVGIAKAERRVNPDGLAPRMMVSSCGRSGLYTQPTISAATMGRSAGARLVRHHSHTRRAMLRWWTWNGVQFSRIR